MNPEAPNDSAAKSLGEQVGPTPNTLDIHHLPADDGQSGRFEAWVEGQRCELDYRLVQGKAWFTHTGVPRALEGRGLAAQLVAHGLGWAQAQGYKVKPVCSYVAVYIRRHPEWSGLVT